MNNVKFFYRVQFRYLKEFKNFKNLGKQADYSMLETKTEIFRLWVWLDRPNTIQVFWWFMFKSQSEMDGGRGGVLILF